MVRPQVGGPAPTSRVGWLEPDMLGECRGLSERSAAQNRQWSWRDLSELRKCDKEKLTVGEWVYGQTKIGSFYYHPLL